MNKLLTIFFLSLVSAKASAQLNTFESGQTIRADEMNENFEYLVGEIRNQGPSNCSGGQLVGRWGYVGEYDGEREEIIFEFFGDGTGTVDISGAEPAVAEAVYSVDDGCKISIDLGSGGALGEGFLALNGAVFTVVFYSPGDDQFDKYTFVKIGV